MDEGIAVLYIGGSGRSGSTLLDNVLGQVEGACSVGELRFLWERGLLDDRPCGCGAPFSRCPFWQSVLSTAFPDRVPDARVMQQLMEPKVRARNLRAILSGRSRADAELTRALTALYSAVAEVSGARVIVDSSKLPPYGALIQRLPAVRFAVVHLVRDPRATAYSWMRRRPLPDYQGQRLMQQQPPWKASWLWALWNVVAELLWRTIGPRYLRVRYEDFIDAPEATVREVCGLVGLPTDQLPFLDERTVELAPTHSVAGNPSRFSQGAVLVRPDSEWIGSMRRRDYAVVTGLTWPLLLRYRYPLTRGAR